MTSILVIVLCTISFFESGGRLKRKFFSGVGNLSYPDEEARSISLLLSIPLLDLFSEMSIDSFFEPPYALTFSVSESTFDD